MSCFWNTVFTKILTSIFAILLRPNLLKDLSTSGSNYHLMVPEVLEWGTGGRSCAL